MSSESIHNFAQSHSPQLIQVGAAHKTISSIKKMVLCY